MSTSENASGEGSNVDGRTSAPWPIPATATVQVENKHGYRQVKYVWQEDGWHYEARWHSRLPGATIVTYPSWRLDRILPGKGFGPHAASRVSQTWVGGKWYASRYVRYITSLADRQPTANRIAFIRAAHPAAPSPCFSRKSPLFPPK